MEISLSSLHLYLSIFQQKDYFNFLRKGKMKKSEGDYVWGTLTEEGL